MKIKTFMSAAIAVLIAVIVYEKIPVAFICNRDFAYCILYFNLCLHACVPCGQG